MEQNIDTYITNAEYKKLLNCIEFLPVFCYSKNRKTRPGELGILKVIGTPDMLIKFHLKRTSVNAEVMLKILDEIESIGTTYPKGALEKLKQITKYIKEKKE
jgi:hypothetical protein